MGIKRKYSKENSIFYKKDVTNDVFGLAVTCEAFWAIFHHMQYLKNVKNIHEACNFNKSNTPPWMFFAFFKLYKWCQIAQSITCRRLTITKLWSLLLPTLQYSVVLRRGLTHFRRTFPFYIPRKCQKTSGFLAFSGGIEREYWREMGWIREFFYISKHVTTFK